jgi:hypothetical protein
VSRSENAIRFCVRNAIAGFSEPANILWSKAQEFLPRQPHLVLRVRRASTGIYGFGLG